MASKGKNKVGSTLSPEAAVEDQFGVFVHWARELSERRLIRGGNLAARFNISVDRDGPWQFNLDRWDHDDLRALLTNLRPFVANKSDPTHLGRVLNLCERCLTSEELRNQLRNLRSGWKEALRGYGVQFFVNDQQLVPEDIMDLLLNVKYFHPGDAAERAKLARMTSDPIERLLSDYIFQNLVVDAVRVVLATAQVIRIARRRNLFDYSLGVP